MRLEMTRVPCWRAVARRSIPVNKPTVRVRFGASCAHLTKGEPMRRSISLRRMRGSYFLGPSFFVGILAAIAIPAYHDYGLRVKVTEGLNMAAAVKLSVTEFYLSHGKWPRDLRELEFEAVPRGQYVTFVAVNRGTVVIRYSRAAGGQLARQQLTLRPTVTAEGDVLWGCGYTPSPGVDPKTGASSGLPTSVHPKYLPSMCRGG